jgi:hypothetical protein
MKSLFLLAMIGILLLGFFTYLSLSVTSVNQVQVSVTTIDLVSNPLNYTAYQIQEPATAVIILSYSFPRNSGTGVLNMTSGLGNTTVTGNSVTSYTACDFPLNGANNDCGVHIVPTEPEINYFPNSNATVTFMISVSNATNVGYYLFFPAGGQCGYSISLIIGNKVPSKLPTLTPNGCISNRSIPHAYISVVGIENMTGLNIPY